MAASLAISPRSAPPAQLRLVNSEPLKFNSAFLERRMREHREWQHRESERQYRQALQYLEDRLNILAARARQAERCAAGFGPAKIARMP